MTAPGGTATSRTGHRTGHSIGAWIAGLALTALYGYAVVAAVGNLIGMPQIAAALGLNISAAGWVWMSIGVVIPVLLFVLALLIGRRQTAWTRVLILAAGICLVAVLQLDILHEIPRSSYFV